MFNFDKNRLTPRTDRANKCQEITGHEVKNVMSIAN